MDLELLGGQFALAEDAHVVTRLGNHAGTQKGGGINRLLGVELASINRGLQAAEVHLDILLAEDVGEATLRQTAMDRHLAALEAVDRHAGTCLLTLVTATRRLAGTRTDAASNALAVLGSTRIITDFVEFHHSLLEGTHQAPFCFDSSLALNTD